MPDYKDMYLKLFTHITDAIHMLQEAQLEGEDAYIESNDEPILLPLTDLLKEPDDKNQ